MTWTPLYAIISARSQSFGLMPVKGEGRICMFDAYDWLDMEGCFYWWGGVESPFYPAPAGGAQ